MANHLETREEAYKEVINAGRLKMLLVFLVCARPGCSREQHESTDGRLVVQVPNASCWQFLMFGKAWNGVDVPRHLINFKQKDLDSLLDACGFEVLRHKHFSLRDNPAGLATTLAPSLDPMARRVRGDGALESPRMKLFKDLVYLGLVVGSIPFTAVEAICHSGSTIMVEARKKP